MLVSTPEHHLSRFEPHQYDAVLALSRRVYGPEHRYAEDWRFLPDSDPNPDEPRLLVRSRKGDLLAFAGLRAQPWMLHVRKRGLQMLVHPEWHGQGLGSELLVRLEDAALDLGVRGLVTTVLTTRQETLKFLTARGFQELDRYWTLTYDLHRGPEPTIPAELPDGMRAESLAVLRDEDEACFRKYHALWVAVAMDQPNYDPATAPPVEEFCRWMGQRQRLLHGTFVALDGDRYVGMSMVQTREPKSKALLQNITGVLRDYRRRGIATALKRRVIQYGREWGAEQVVTQIDHHNDAMLALNEKLGFQRATGKVRLEKAL
jgi:GNAT superfamily N-acetyltransferase